MLAGCYIKSVADRSSFILQAQASDTTGARKGGFACADEQHQCRMMQKACMHVSMCSHMTDVTHLDWVALSMQIMPVGACSTACQEEFAVTTAYDYYGNDLQGSPFPVESPLQCQAACYVTAGCQAFTFVPSDGELFSWLDIAAGWHEAADTFLRLCSHVVSTVACELI